LDNFWARCRQGCESATQQQRRIAGLIGVYLAFYLLIDADVLTRPYLVSPLNNLNVAEGQAWLNGRLDLDARPTPGSRPWDSAVFEDRVYNVFPPMFTLISVPVMAVGPPGVPNYILILLLALPLPGLAYALFLRRTDRVYLAVLLSLGYLLGTSLLPLMNQGLRDGEVWHVDHLLCQLGLLIFLLDYFGHRRIWVGGIGLIIAAWSRQLTALYVIPLAYLALRHRGTSTRWWRALSFAVVTVVMAALPATLNTLKFGSPLDSGYRYVYDGRDDEMARDARRGLFSPVFLPRNLYYMNLGFPEVVAPYGVVRFRPNSLGAGIWWTTPVLLLVLVDWRRLWRRRDVRYLLIGAAAVFAVLMLYHTTGRAQRGYNRFSMDFVIVLLAAVGPLCGGQKRKWVTFAFVLWSVWYFRWAI
jgi:hypothetical protein